MIDLNLFQVTEKDGLRLIIPSRDGAVGNAPWTPDTTQYRSRVETLEGETVSQGFKKFFNLDQGPDGLRVEVADILKAIEQGDALATLKLDGTLLIRSVWQGKVMLRTRGSFGYENLDNADEIEEFRSKYPILFEAAYYPALSLLFEWTSPRNVIVLKYFQPQLTLIGAVSHFDLSYEPLRRLVPIANHLQVPLIESFLLTRDGWDQLQARLDTDSTIEGYVIRLNWEQDLVKVKCAPYLTKHAMKSTLTTEKLVDRWLQQGKPEFKAFTSMFLIDFDEETLMWALGAISAMFDGIREFREIERHMKAKATSRRDWSRKEAAIYGLAEYGQTKRFSAYMNLWEGKPISPDLIKSIIMQSCKNVEIGMFRPTGQMEE